MEYKKVEQKKYSYLGQIQSLYTTFAARSCIDLDQSHHLLKHKTTQNKITLFYTTLTYNAIHNRLQRNLSPKEIFSQ